MKYDLFIGIDPGTKTGLAIWDAHEQDFKSIATMSIVRAMSTIFKFSQKGYAIKVRLEDARLWVGFKGRQSANDPSAIARLQGAGSVKRDCSIWAEFCEDQGIDIDLVSPKDNTTKTTAKYFKSITKWDGRTSEHSRDAAMLVVGSK